MLWKLIGIDGEQEYLIILSFLRGIYALYETSFDFQVHAFPDIVTYSQALPTVLPSVHPNKSTTSLVVSNLVEEVQVIDGLQNIIDYVRKWIELQKIEEVKIDEVTSDKLMEDTSQNAIKIFVSGDRSKVGKSTVCLGLIGSLLRLGYKAVDIGYIKPATQCEKVQLVARFCRHNGIKCCDIGPILFYSGFTREFLKGNTETAEELLQKAKEKVDEIAQGKKIVIVDGVGYPAVGSICSVSNASVAKAIGAPVVLIGKNGVGDAVDSFNLNATFFESHQVPVLGGIFNRFPSEGYYGLENCRESINRYFQQYQPHKKIYGLLPEIKPNNIEAEKEEEMKKVQEDEEGFTSVDDEQAKAVVDLVLGAVDIHQLIRDAAANQDFTCTKGSILPKLQSTNLTASNLEMSRTQKRDRVNDITNPPKNKKTRDEILQAARASGASGG
jgi:dethiobiotin synthetase